MPFISFVTANGLKAHLSIAKYLLHKVYIYGDIFCINSFGYRLNTILNFKDNITTSYGVNLLIIHYYCKI